MEPLPKRPPGQPERTRSDNAEELVPMPEKKKEKKNEPLTENAIPLPHYGAPPTGPPNEPFKSLSTREPLPEKKKEKKKRMSPTKKITAAAAGGGVAVDLAVIIAYTLPELPPTVLAAIVGLIVWAGTVAAGYFMPPATEE